MHSTPRKSGLRPWRVVTGLALASLIVGCQDNRSDPARADLADTLMTDSLDFRDQVDPQAPYAGEWARKSSECDEERKLWTIEPRRMAIVPSMRFCLFEKVYVNTAEQEGETVWSAASQCLAEGRESQDFVFFRLKENLKDMRVTFNDSRSVELVRCVRS